MIRKDVHAVVRAFTKQYIHAKKKEKSETLNRLVKTTGYSRKHLMEILPNPPKLRKRKQRIQRSKYLDILKPLQMQPLTDYSLMKGDESILKEDPVRNLVHF